MDTIVIVLIIVIVLLVYFLYKASNKSSSSSTLYNLNNSNSAIVNSDLTNPTSYTFSYESWIYVNTWNNTNDKVFYYASPSGTTDLTSSNTVISLTLGKSTPTLYCKINSSASNISNPPIVVSTNFPIQKWVYVVISVDSQIVDCYLDGKLIKSTKLLALPNTSPTYDINFGTCDAYITGFKRNANAVNPQTVWSNYMSGNGYSGNSYGMNVAITKDNVTMSEVSY